MQILYNDIFVKDRVFRVKDGEKFRENLSPYFLIIPICR